MNTIEGVKEIYDLHVWDLSMGKISFSWDIFNDNSQKNLKKAKKMIERKYNIAHITIQVEKIIIVIN